MVSKELKREIVGQEVPDSKHTVQQEFSECIEPYRKVDNN